MEIQGIVEDIIFRNESNGYTVGKLYTSDGSITIVGIAPFLHKDEAVSLEGEWSYHSRFGEQFQFDTLKSIMPTTTKGIENYLSSGLIPHIGPKTAKKIVEHFGPEALDIIQYNPQRLLEIEGIGEKKLRRIMESYDDQREMRDVMVALQNYSLSINQSMKIYKQYGKDAVNVVRENPYRLAEDISGMGFKTADEIASRLGMDKSSPYRLEAGLKFVMMSAAGEGHCYLPKDELMKKTMQLLQVGEEGLEGALTTLLLRQSFHSTPSGDETRIYYMPYHTAENNVAKALAELSLVQREDILEDIDQWIEQLERKQGFPFGDKQKLAIKGAIEDGTIVITGGPGTGKTTIITAIIDLLERENKRVVLAAPTGRAAKRMTEATGMEAKTLHRLLEISYMNENLQFSKNEESPIDADAIIVDEMSMVDILLMNNLVKAIKPGTRLIMVGDVDQLPSVGAGNVLRDIIDSGVVRVVRLDEIFRQESESMIIVNAHLINKGETPRLNEKGKDFFYIHKSTGQEIREEIEELTTTRLPSFYGYDPIKDIQVLTPMRKGDAGVAALNKSLQKALNPPAKNKAEKLIGDEIYRVGDKVMQIRNNYQALWTVDVDGRPYEEGEGIFNGDFGFIKSIDEEEGIVTVLFDDDREVEFEMRQMDDLKLAYATTIHKSQGSEFPAVIIPVYSGPPMLLTRNLLYTAVTRAKDLVVLVGDKRYMHMMIRNNQIAKRYSSLNTKLRDYFHFIISD
ncbi:ATP-dependent RecD-like DNA helicase [Gudongella oleilytica]|uniref:SF1B family DNA helicase RecD2 n=1 Tax=Gudongella oleilytica TaxID=1582259 RepID=UPI002A368CE8|nr:ATP-dependent RecD-like DNA helicase [Gudongella oleilytica]MDY0256696.1 ATP-dependent RecD-like DNA helicase [Gudongella oleilytica]